MSHVATTGSKYTATKAIVGAVVAGIVSGLGVLTTALGDGQVSALEVVLIISAVLVGSGLTGSSVYNTENKLK